MAVMFSHWFSQSLLPNKSTIGHSAIRQLSLLVVVRFSKRHSLLFHLIEHRQLLASACTAPLSALDVQKIWLQNWENSSDRPYKGFC
jgi:hypothetical protein